MRHGFSGGVLYDFGTAERNSDPGNGPVRPDLYTALVASEKLYEHCAEIDEAVRSRIDLIMPELAKSAGATEELKAAGPMSKGTNFHTT